MPRPAADDGYTIWRPDFDRRYFEKLIFGQRSDKLSPRECSQLKQCFPGCTHLICSCTASADYWTSTVFEPFPVSATIVDFQVGLVRFDYTSSSSALHRVRAVRGGL